MSNKVKRRCAQCGARAVVGFAQPGRKTTYRNMGLEIPASVEIPTCAECGAEWIDVSTAAALDEALEAVYQQRLRERLDSALDKILGEDTSQARVERALGVSPGYLSKLKMGRRNPSAELVMALGLVSKDPEKRLAEVEAFLNPPGGRKRATG